jgi:adenosylcobinamide kinase/adenosylcobinamide-phosphate guanylyltransferase
MIVCDEESRKRMERHQRQRAGMYFETVERPFGLERLTFKEKERLILLECMSNLIANELYGGENFAMRDPKETKETIIRGIGHLREHAEHLVVVSNEMFRNGTYSVEMNDYLKVAGQVDRYLAGCSDIVIESVFGIPYFWKREKRLWLEKGKWLWDKEE